jgi:putative toxin-antitoxin system antitoxin component (TIGR02293 family)
MPNALRKSKEATDWPEPGASGAAGLLGGRTVLGRRVANAVDAHDLILAGLPATSLHHLVDSLSEIEVQRALEQAVGLSLRTLQRTRHDPERRLSTEQSGRVWKFAEVLAKAPDRLGSQKQAEHWLDSPALGLGRRRPLDLMTTPAGLDMVETYLGRLEYGVYT